MNLPGNLFYFNWEITLMEWLQGHLSGEAVAVLSKFSMLGETLVLVVVLGYFYWCYDKEIGKFIGMNYLVGNLANTMLKNAFLRLRPFYASDKIQLLRKVDESADIYDVTRQGYAFPSGHAQAAAVIYGSVTASFKKKWLVVLTVVLCLLVGISRVVVGAHYPTDVLFGWALGASMIFVVPWVRRKIPNWWAFSLVLALLGMPGFLYCTSTDYYTSYGMMLGFLLAVPFEEKYVRFENTRSILKSFLRLAGGGAVYFGLNTVLKLPFSSEFLEAGTFASHLVRTIRYGMIIFVVIGVYPIVFKYTAKIGKK